MLADSISVHKAMFPRQRRGNPQPRRPFTQMTGPKKVAIIGAGPSGLVTAKTLFHDFPNGTFAPVIFEQRHDIGGLWPSSPTETTNNTKTEPTTLDKAKQNEAAVGPLNPFMRTNLSRFTVAFSDLTWESVIEDTEVSMFPQAWQVGRYLEKYAERFLTNGMLRLGRRVVRTSRKVGAGEGRRWTVQWVESGDDGNGNREIKSKEFDFLVVASGYFSSPHIPDIPGLDGFMERTIHSSFLHNAERLLQKSHETGGKLVVIGGSLSGTEAASTLALHVSSSKFTREAAGEDYQVHHVCTRPFWTIPAYLPRESPGKETISFVPLDLVMYDLARRPPGPVEYAFGPIPVQKAQKTNDYLFSVLGDDYGKFGNVRGDNKEASQPPWVAIGNDYAEYVRSGAITPTVGRVSAVHRNHNSKLATIDISLPGDKKVTLDNVAAIVLATGFTPYNSLSFLPSPILSTLEYSESDPFFPLILDGKGTTHAEIPDIGFVGFYRGPYWGAMEMQARHIAADWARAEPDDCGINTTKKEERQRLRDLRNMDPNLHRGQFPMGDYVGLMESFSRELGMSRTSLERQDNGSDREERSGPVLPARYKYAGESPSTIETHTDTDRETTLHFLRSILSPKPSQPNTPCAATATATSTAIFRALHGTWKVTHTYHHDHPQLPDKESHGTATFHPRHPTSPAYEKEYLYEEPEFVSGEHPAKATTTTRSIFRLRAPVNTSIADPNTSRILVWSVDMTKDPNAALQLLYGINPAMAAIPSEDKEPGIGAYTMHATGTSGLIEAGGLAHVSSDGGRGYTFQFQGVAILSWECRARTDEGCCIRTVYERD